jgi:hypothetical protein
MAALLLDRATNKNTDCAIGKRTRRNLLGLHFNNQSSVVCISMYFVIQSIRYKRSSVIRPLLVLYVVIQSSKLQMFFGSDERDLQVLDLRLVDLSVASLEEANARFCQLRIGWSLVISVS